MMMKKYASLLFALFLALSLSVSAAADADVYVYDDADILSTDECAALNEAAAAVSEQYGCGVYVVTVGDTANAAFTDYGKYIMQDEFLDNFREDDWYGGFADYIAACGRYLEANANGAPIDVEPSDETEEEYEPLSFGDKLFFAALMAFRFGLPLGLIVAFIVCAIYKRQLKSVRRATEAARYTVSGGAEITAREDRFTHTTEVRTPIKTESDDHDSGPSFSGGTTVNSGGFSHSGGKF